ncbi:DUF6185 family protein [Streptomyces sp. NPDC001315]|uniref:DUF6185 family protein n=1 Tax=Streptomyces sp. NPDC001315 TaxID=3364562 RepID=UPI0036C15F25
MTRMRWWRLLPLAVIAVMWWGCSPAEARQDNRDVCLTDQLNTRDVDATIRFDPHGKNYIKVYSSMTVTVPVKEWPLAKHLTFSEESAEYRTAMRCLLRGQDNSRRPNEWRTHNPVVTSENGTVTVRYDSFAWIKDYSTFQLGPWRIARTEGERWKVSLQSPTLQTIPWRHVEAKLGGLNFNDRYGKASSSDENGLKWNNQLPGRIMVEVELPWQRSWILSYDQSFWGSVGIAAWWVCGSIVIVLAALRTQRSYASPAFGTLAPRWRVGKISGRRGESPAQPVLLWALLSGAVALILILITSQPPVKTRWRTLICIAAGLALIFAARPWSRSLSTAAPSALADESDVPEGRRRRQARAVIGCASTVAAVGMLVVLAPELFGLSPSPTLESTGPPTVFGKVGYVLMGLATVWLWLAAMAAWAWRFAGEGGLVRTRWTVRWGRAPLRCVVGVSVLLGVIAGGLLACLWWVSENQWERVTWLTDQKGPAAHGVYVSNYLANFSYTILTWVFSYSWVLTGIALFALLNFRTKAQRVQAGPKVVFSLGPERPDLLLIVAVFTFTVGLRGATITGTNAQYSVWLWLNIGSLFMVLASGRRWSVFSQMGLCFYVRRLGTSKRRRELMTKAHEYRNLNHQLRLLDQGRAGGMTREQLEDQLHRQRRWLVAGCDTKNPPSQISVLDIALAWGPEDHWWSNALHAARLAFCFGIPASGVLLFLEMMGDWNVMRLTNEPTRIPSVVAIFFSYQVAWTGAGFVLGALWRLLPGRRGPLRAWSLTFAYAVPACLTALIIEFTDADLGLLLFYSMLMLTILTLTSIWMDTATFRQERQYWPSRFALLQSIYQLGGFSGQITWLLAQVVAAVGIWRAFVKH